MWQPVTNHEEAYEYLQLGVLWHGVPPDDVDLYRVEHNNLTRERFLRLCANIGGVGGFIHPHYIYVEE